VAPARDLALSNAAEAHAAMESRATTGKLLLYSVSGKQLR
jgi:hypothetical protein